MFMLLQLYIIIAHCCSSDTVTHMHLLTGRVETRPHRRRRRRRAEEVGGDPGVQFTVSEHDDVLVNDGGAAIPATVEGVGRRRTLHVVEVDVNEL